MTKLSKSQVSVMAAELDEMVASFRSRPLDAGPYAFVWIDALTQKVREGGRTVNVHALIATGVNANGKRNPRPVERASLRGRRGVAGVPARPVRPRPVRGATGHLRLPPRAAGRHRRGAARRILAKVPGALLPSLATKVPRSAQPSGCDAGAGPCWDSRRSLGAGPAPPRWSPR